MTPVDNRVHTYPYICTLLSTLHNTVMKAALSLHKTYYEAQKKALLKDSSNTMVHPSPPSTSSELRTLQASQQELAGRPTEAEYRVTVAEQQQDDAVAELQEKNRQQEEEGLALFDMTKVQLRTHLDDVADAGIDAAIRMIGTTNRTFDRVCILWKRMSGAHHTQSADICGHSPIVIISKKR